MSETMDAKAAILERIRTAVPSNDSARQQSYEAIARNYIRSGKLTEEARLNKLEERLREYDAGVYRTTPTDLAKTLSAVLTERKVHRIGIARETPLEWLPGDFAFHEVENAPATDLDRIDGVLTGCTVAIAETGSLVLQNAAAQGPRKLSLVPDYHCCIVFANQVVETVPEAFDRLAGTATLPTTFISGPSATADIEMTRIKGVHGPRFLDVILVS